MSFDPLLQMFSTLSRRLGDEEWTVIAAGREWPFPVRDHFNAYEFFVRLMNSCYGDEWSGRVSNQDVSFLKELIAPWEDRFPGALEIVQRYEEKYIRDKAKPASQAVPQQQANTESREKRQRDSPSYGKGVNSEFRQDLEKGKHPYRLICQNVADRLGTDWKSPFQAWTFPVSLTNYGHRDGGAMAFFMDMDRLDPGWSNLNNDMRGLQNCLDGNQMPLMRDVQKWVKEYKTYVHEQRQALEQFNEEQGRTKEELSQENKGPADSNRVPDRFLPRLRRDWEKMKKGEMLDDARVPFPDVYMEPPGAGEAPCCTCDSGFAIVEDCDCKKFGHGRCVLCANEIRTQAGDLSSVFPSTFHCPICK